MVLRTTIVYQPTGNTGAHPHLYILFVLRYTSSKAAIVLTRVTSVCRRGVMRLCELKEKKKKDSLMGWVLNLTYGPFNTVYRGILGVDPHSHSFVFSFTLWLLWFFVFQCPVWKKKSKWLQVLALLKLNNTLCCSVYVCLFVSLFYLSTNKSSFLKCKELF